LCLWHNVYACVLAAENGLCRVYEQLFTISTIKEKPVKKNRDKWLV